jgi:23S rRNA (guanine745-N1)-methyltransferase
MKQTLLRCPACHKQLYLNEKSYSCGKHHFDIAKEGYVNLCIPPIKGDDLNLVQARESFFHHNPYEPLMRAILPWISSQDTVLDMGCGIGSYLQYLKTNLPSLTTIGFDGSKHAIKKAAKSDKTGQYVVGNINACPIIDHEIDVVLSVFAPFQINEVKRVLKPKGLFINVEPGENHLLELKSVLYPTLRVNNVTEPLTSSFNLVHEETIDFTLNCDQPLLMSLFHMTPYAYTTSKDAQERLTSLTHLNVLASFVLRIYKTQ